MNPLLYQAIAEYIAGTNALLKDFALSGAGYPQLVPFDLAGQLQQTPMIASPRIVAAGVAVVAQDTGRCLLLQRSAADPDDPAAGKWEFPGGRCEEEETAWGCAAREWMEEIGLPLPPGSIVGVHDNALGTYRLYIWLCRSEEQVDLTARDQSRDPDGDYFEAAAWWAAKDLLNLPALRQELADNFPGTLLRSFAQNKRAFAELDQLARYLRHGKDIAKFKYGWLSEQEMQRIAGALVKTSPAAAVAASRARMIGKFQIPARSQQRYRQREQVLRRISTGIAQQLGRLARNAHDSHLSFVDGAAAVLREAYTRAYAWGHKHGSVKKQGDWASEDPDDTEFDDLPPDVQDDIQRDVDDQHGYLQGLVQDMVAGLAGAELGARLDQYAAGAINPYEQGYQDAVLAALGPVANSDNIIATWVVTSEDPCALCEEKNGQSWPAEEAPVPGEGGFGEICEGAFNCRCVLEYDYAPAVEAADVADAGDDEAA